MTTSKLVEYLRAVSKVSELSTSVLIDEAADRLCEQSAVLVEIATSGIGMNGCTPCKACEHNVKICNDALHKAKD